MAKDSKLSRAEMEQVIAGGGSVLHNGQILSHVEHLPTEAQLAKGDPGAEKAALAVLQASIADLQSQVATLNQSQGATQATGGKKGGKGEKTDDAGAGSGEPPKDDEGDPPKDNA